MVIVQKLFVCLGVGESVVHAQQKLIVVCLGGGEPVVHVQKLESMAPEFQSMTEAMRRTPTIVTPTILVDKDGQPSPTKAKALPPTLLPPTDIAAATVGRYGREHR